MGLPNRGRDICPGWRDPRLGTLGGCLVKRPEDILQKDVVDYFREVEARNSDFCFMAIPNAAKRMPRHAAYLKALGLRGGAPDIHFSFSGRAYYIELKAPGLVHGKRKILDHRSEDQKEFHTRLTQAGGIVTTLDSLETVIQFLAICQIPNLPQVA